MADKVKNLLEMIEFPKAGILSVDIMETGKQDITLFVMPEGASIHEHTSTMEATVYTLKGQAEWVIGGEAVTVREGDWFLMPANEVHAIKATSPYAFLLSLHK